MNVTSIDRDSKAYLDYSKYMQIIGSLNAENIQSIDKFKETELFKNLSGEEIFDIALNVCAFLDNSIIQQLTAFEYFNTAKVASW